MTHRRFAQLFIFATAIFVLLNAAVWTLFTRDLLTRTGDTISGDLARIGYVTDLRHPRTNNTDLAIKHLESSDYRGERIDLLTVGDSFSQGAGGGPNRYYQDFIATRLGWTVLNLPRHPQAANDVEFIAMLANSGFLRETGVRYVLLEATQRRAVTRLSADSNLSRVISRSDLDKHYRFGDGSASGFDFALPNVAFINEGNFRFLQHSLLYPLHDCALIAATCRVELTQPLFTIGNGHELLFYKKDVRSIRHHTPEQIGIMNDRLNALADLLGQQGITLLFMPAVSKFDLYRDYFIDDSWARDPFFALLRDQQRDYQLVDTHAILSAGLLAGERDVFYVDDTHWGPRASKRIADALYRLLHPGTTG